ncbi:MAG: DUF4931 domain-containing protein [Acidobacteriota bacterium]
MPEFRHDPLQQRWVIISTERAARPSDLQESTEHNQITDCPFCEGNESKTPSEIWAVREPHTAPNTPGWKVRVVPNKFPALMIEASGKRTGMGVYDMMEGLGAHEVIIETTKHDEDIAELSPEQLRLVLLAYRERIRDLYRDPRFKYGLVFKNHGKRAGASLAHPHSQLIATPVVPRNVHTKLNSSKQHFEYKERCLICDIIEQEVDSSKRLILKNEKFISFTPFASRFPFEIFIAPLQHNHSFIEASDEDLDHLAPLLKDILFRLKKILNDPPYNYIVNTSPNPEAAPKLKEQWTTLKYDYHWHIEIIPRLTRIAGFEWGSGFYINPTVPEDAARYLREAEGP